MSKIWEKIKRFFNRSWTIFQARLTMFAGLITAVLGSVDWSMLITGVQTGMNRTTLLITGGLLFVKGLFEEIGRRANTKTIEQTGQLIPANVEVKSMKVDGKKVK